SGSRSAGSQSDRRPRTENTVECELRNAAQGRKDVSTRRLHGDVSGKDSVAERIPLNRQSHDAAAERKGNQRGAGEKAGDRIVMDAEHIKKHVRAVAGIYIAVF